LARPAQKQKGNPMATDLSPPKAAAGVKYETFLAEKLDQARKRIRFIDVAAAGLGLMIGFLAYGLGMALIDRAWDLAAGVRVLALLVFLGGAGIYVTLALVLPLYRQVNLRYAAKELERTLPGSKNSVINWIDLRDDNLPPAIRGAVGRRAAKDLATADLERALSARRAVWLGGIAAGFAAILLLFFLSSPAQFWSLMGRAFVPFGGGTIVQATEITVITPPGGNHKVSANQAVDIVVGVRGKVPPEARWRGPVNLAVRTDEAGNITGFDKVPYDVDPSSMMLHLRYSPSGAYTQFPLERDGQNNWRVRVPANRVLNGFYYRVTGGDAQTPEYRIQVESTPLVTECQVTYHYPAFLRTNDLTNQDPNWRAVRKTRVAMVVHTNRRLKEGALKLLTDGDPRDLQGVVLKDTPEAMRFEYVLDQNGSYQLRFTARSGEMYDETTRYSIEVDPTTEVKFTYPDYLMLPKADFEVPFVPDLKAVRGTKAILTYHHNQPVKKGQLILRTGGKEKIVDGVTHSRHPEALRFPEFTLDQEGHYQIAYTLGNGNVQRTRWYPIRIIPDDPPQVALTSPPESSKLPATALLKLEGWARDDFGIKNLTLRMQVMKNRQEVVAKLEPKVYREGQTLRTEKGHYPRELDYKDFVELAKVRNNRHQPFKLEAGMEIEYWLEAADNCEYPDARTGPHTAESKHQILTIEPPEKKSPEQQKKEKQDAQNEQKKHEQEQDKKLANEKDQPRPNDSNPENQRQEQGEKKSQDPKQDDLNKKAEQLNKDLKRQENKKNQKDNKGKGEGKQGPKEPEKGRQKPPPESANEKPKNEKGSEKSKPKEQAGENKGEGKKGDNECKGKQGGPKNQQGKEKGKGNPKEGGKNNSDKGSAKGEGKESEEGGDRKNQPAESKASPRSDQKTGGQKGEGKSGDPSKGDSKDQGPKKDNQQPKMNGQSKEGKADSKGHEKGAAKTAPEQGQKKPQTSDAKDNVGKSKAKPNKQSGESQSKKAGKEGKTGHEGDAKSGGQPKPDGQEKMKGEPKGQKGNQPQASKTKGQGRSPEGSKGEGKDQGPKREQSAASGKKKTRPTGKEDQEGKSKGEGTDPTGKQPSEDKRDRSQEDATMNDVREQDRKLDKEDPDAQRQAARNLKKMAEQAKERKVRDAAREALKKRQENQGNDNAAASKGQDPKKQGTEGKGKARGKDSGPMKEGPGKEKRDGSGGKAKGTPKERDPKNKGEATTKGPPRNNGQLPKDWDKEDLEGKPTKPTHGKEAGDLNLDNLMEKLSKMSPEERRQLLQKNNMTEKDYQDLKDYQQARKAKTDNRKAKGPKDGRLRNQGPRQVTKDSTKADKVSQGGGRPPAEYADIVEQYSRKLRDRAPSKP
jgi:hypothetical protein